MTEQAHPIIHNRQVIGYAVLHYFDRVRVMVEDADTAAAFYDFYELDENMVDVDEITPYVIRDNGHTLAYMIDEVDAIDLCECANNEQGAQRYTAEEAN